MNEKEARTIWAMHLRPSANCNCANGTGESCQKAQGYLLAIEKMRPLVDASKQMADAFERPDLMKPGENLLMLVRKYKEALARWNKGQL